MQRTVDALSVAATVQPAREAVCRVMGLWLALPADGSNSTHGELAILATDTNGPAWHWPWPTQHTPPSVAYSHVTFFPSDVAWKKTGGVLTDREFRTSENGERSEAFRSSYKNCFSFGKRRSFLESFPKDPLLLGRAARRQSLASGSVRRVQINPDQERTTPPCLLNTIPIVMDELTGALRFQVTKCCSCTHCFTRGVITRELCLWRR